MKLCQQLLVLGVITCGVLHLPSNADADPRVRVGFSVGNGGFRVGVGNGPIYGPGYYGPGYGYGGYPVVVRPYPVYAQPQPVYVQPQPVYVTPQPSYTSSPTIIRDSVIPAPPTPFSDGGEILLFSPATNHSDIRYTLNGHSYTMAPGTKQSFKNDRTWTIAFESQPGQVTTYTLVSSRYKFKSNQESIGLFQTQDLPESVGQSVSPQPAPPIPQPPIPDSDGDVVPPRIPSLKTNP